MSAACPATACCTGLICSGAGTCSAGTPLVFTAVFQTLPNTGTDVIEFRCTGTILQAGRRCEVATGGDPVELRINGTLYKLYGGCGGSTQCMTMVVGTGFKDITNVAPPRLFCEAMGYTAASTLTNTAVVGVASRGVATVQNYPYAYGTATKVNAISFVECVP